MDCVFYEVKKEEILNSLKWGATFCDSRQKNGIENLIHLYLS